MAFDFEITDDMEEQWQGAVDSLMSNLTGLGRKVTLVFPLTEQNDCPNCIQSPFGSSARRYNSNNPNPVGPLNISFNFGNCSVCAGRGYIENLVPKQFDINMLCLPISYLDKWQQVDASIAGSDSDYYAVGYMTDKENVERCDRAIMRGDTVKRQGPLNPIGLKSDRYFESAWKKISN